MARVRALLALLAAGVLHVCAQPQPPIYGTDSPIIKLDKKGWAEMQSDLAHVWVVEFYADWCGHCKQFAPAFEKAAGNLKHLVKFGGVNADSAQDLMSANGVSGFPTVKVFLPEVKQNPYTGKREKEVHLYNGPRTAKGVVDFVTKLVPNLVVPVQDEAALSAFVAQGADHLGEPSAQPAAHARRALLFSAKAETSLMLKALALRLRGRLAVGEAKQLPAEPDEDGLPAMARQNGVSSLPGLVVLPSAVDGAEGGEPEVYSGELKYEPLWAFLSARAGPEPAPAASGAGSDSKARARSLDFVVSATHELYMSEIEPDAGAWVLAFEHGSTTEADDASDPARVPALAKLATQLRGQARVALVNASEPSGGKLAAALGVAEEKMPALRVLPYGKGAKGAASAIVVEDAVAARRAAGESLPTDSVQQLTSANVDQFLSQTAAAMTGAPEGMPPAHDVALASCILFTDKSSVPPLYRAVALFFAGVFDFGLAPASDAPLMQRFSMSKVPSLLCLWVQGQPNERGEVGMQGAHYDESQGTMSFGTLGTFLANLGQQLGGPGWQQRMGAGTGGGGGTASGHAGAGGGAGSATEVQPVPELTAENIGSVCGDGTAIGLCAIALLDGERTPDMTEAREAQLRTLDGLAHRRRGDTSVRLAWLDATCHDNFPASFDISDADLPTMVVLSPSKSRYAKLMGTFTVEGMSRFINAVTAGRASTTAFERLPALDESIDCETTLRGAAKAAALEAGAEEDEDMGDIMAEILEEERQRQAALQAELEAAGAGGAPGSTGSGAAGAGAGAPKKPKEEMSELERLEDELEECGAHDLLCAARREKQLKAIEKRRALEEKLQEIADKKKKKKKKAKKTAA